MRREAPEETIETSFLDLLAAIDAIAETDDEALAVLEHMLAEGRVLVVRGANERSACLAVSVRPPAGEFSSSRPTCASLAAMNLDLADPRDPYGVCEPPWEDGGEPRRR